jgi:hypothetical protein
VAGSVKQVEKTVAALNDPDVTAGELAEIDRVRGGRRLYQPVGPSSDAGTLDATDRLR